MQFCIGIADGMVYRTCVDVPLLQITISAGAVHRRVAPAERPSKHISTHAFTHQIGLDACDDDVEMLNAMLQYMPSMRPTAAKILEFSALQNSAPSTPSTFASACSTPKLTS